MGFDLKQLGGHAKQLIRQVGEQAKSAAQTARHGADRAAETAARKLTELTGRETTASEVKAAALVAAGAALMATVAAAAVACRYEAESLAAGGSDGGWGADFESQTSRFFAEGGHPISYYTPQVDSTGTVIYDPNA